MQVISWVDARSQGLSRFFTGRPCKRGHVSQRYVGNNGGGTCVECAKLAKHDPVRRKAYKETRKERDAMLWQEYYTKNREFLIQRGREFSLEKRQTDFEWVKKSLINRIRSAAKERSLEFDITVYDIEWPEYCPVFGTKLIYMSTKINDIYSASFDRTDSSKGYIKGNVRIISRRANTCKSNCTLEEIRLIYQYILNPPPVPTSHSPDLDSIQIRKRRKSMWNNSRMRAKAHGLPYPLEKEDLYLPKYCSATGYSLHVV